MNLAGPFFALLAAGAWGATDFVGGVTSRAAGVLVTLLMVQVYGTLLSLALLPFAGEAIPEPAALVWAAASGASGLVGVGCLFLALSRGTMGLVAPLAALVAVSVPAVVGVVSGDRIGLLLAAGLVVATVAIVVISLPDRRLGTPALATFHGSRAREWLLILVSGLEIRRLLPRCRPRARRRRGDCLDACQRPDHQPRGGLRRDRFRLCAPAAIHAAGATDRRVTGPSYRAG